MMDFKKFFNTDTGKTIISILLGLGLATLFRKDCEGNSCLDFKAPDLEDIKKKIFKYGNKCFKYDMETIKCDNKKKYVNFA